MYSWMEAGFLAKRQRVISPRADWKHMTSRKDAKIAKDRLE